MKLLDQLKDRFGKPQKEAGRIAAKAAFYTAVGAGFGAAGGNLTEYYNVMVLDGPWGLSHAETIASFGAMYGLGSSLHQDLKHDS
jgi:hypothetical protein